MNKVYEGTERRKYIRLDYVSPLAYKVCKKETISMLLKGYTANVSEAGLLCHIQDQVHKDDFIWLSFGRETLTICTDMEKRSLVYQNGIIGKVVRVDHMPEGGFNVGVKFITREEKNLTHIYPKIYFIEKHLNNPEDIEEETNDEETT